MTLTELLTPNGFFLIMGVFVAGSLLSLAFFRLKGGVVSSTLAHALSLAGSALALLFAGGVLWTGQGIEWVVEGGFPFLPYSFRVDALAVFFMAIIATVAAASSLFGLGYHKHYAGKYSLSFLGFLYPLFVASLFLVVTANHAYFFLLSWEIMSVTSFLLVTYEFKKASNARAGFLYFLMTHLGTAAIALAFFLIYGVIGSFNFNDWRGAGAALTGWVQIAVFALALIGFGTKAGIIPLHIWLPEAHPAAPSHVSALLSGVMLKTAIYMLIRFFLDFFPGADMRWGLLILALGAISSLLGVLYALTEHDLKRLLAYHSVENIGIILLGLGSSIVFFSMGLDSVAFFGLAAALYHTMNHAIFKALLFLGAGAVSASTGTRNIEKYGGLIKRMPYTAFFFLVGSMAISAFPPLNGFASEWLTFQSLFFGIASSSVWVKALFIFGIASLAFTGGLAAACFVKAFGATFLARARTEEAREAREASPSMLWAMGFLTVLCVVLGVFSTVVIAGLVGVSGSLSLAGADSLAFPFREFIEARSSFDFILPLRWVAMGLVVFIALVWFVTYLFTRRRFVRTGPTWDCGTPLSPRNEITAESFSRSIVTVFQGVLRPTRQKEIEYHDEQSRYFTKYESVSTALSDPYRRFLYRPASAVLLIVARQAKRVQSGNVNVYVAYILITLIVLLLWAAR